MNLRTARETAERSVARLTTGERAALNAALDLEKEQPAITAFVKLFEADESPAAVTEHHALVHELKRQGLTPGGVARASAVWMYLATETGDPVPPDMEVTIVRSRFRRAITPHLPARLAALL